MGDDGVIRRAMFLAVLAGGLAAAGCCGMDKKDKDAQAAPGGPAGVVSEVSRAGPPATHLALTTLPAGAAADFVARLKDATTENLDGPGLSPVAQFAIPVGATLATVAGGGEGVIVAASEPDAKYTVDGYPAEKIAAAPDGKADGWYRAAKRLGAGVHALHVEKEGYFPLDAQVLVQPGVYEVVAVRLARAVLRAAPATGGAAAASATPVAPGAEAKPATPK